MSENESNEVQEKNVIVRQHGCLPPLNWDDDFNEHIYLQYKLWNRLVEIEKDLRTRYRDVFNSDSDVAPLVEKQEALQKIVEDLYEQRKQIKIKIKKKKGPETAFLDNAISLNKEKLKLINAELKEKRKNLKEFYAPQIKKLDEERKELIKEARNSSGLWWGNYNAVVDSYTTARNRVLKTNAELKFHRFDGSGRFTIQLQGGAGISDICNGKRNEVFIELMNSQEFAVYTGRGHSPHKTESSRDLRQYGILNFTVFTGKNENNESFRKYLKLPIIFHRPIPENALIKMITVKKKKIGTDFIWSATFTATTSEPILGKKYSTDMVCAINFGWKQTEQGLRVATVQGSDKNLYHINLPQKTTEKLAYIKTLQSRIDTMTNENFEWLFTVTKNLEMPEKMLELYVKLKRAKNPHPASFARFVILWRKEFSDITPELIKLAELRRKKCKKVELEMTNLREKTMQHRLDFYRNEAKKIAERYGLIVLDKMMISELAKLEKDDGTPTELNDKARSQRQSAAVSILREWIILQAKKMGSRIEIKNLKSSTTCHECNSSISRQSGLKWKCKCGAEFDQDVNATAVLLRAVV